jgi:hypothetical protein
MNVMSPTSFPAAADISLAKPLPGIVEVSYRIAREAEAQASLHAFGDCMELAMSGLVMTGVLLFGAALLRCGVGPCLLRSVGIDGLTGLAGMSGLAMLGGVSRGLYHLVRIRMA